MRSVRAWVRALAGGRRRVVGRWPGASMVLAIRPAVRQAPPPHAVVHRHDHHHRHEHRHRHVRHHHLASARAEGPAPAPERRAPGAMAVDGHVARAPARAGTVVVADVRRRPAMSLAAPRRPAPATAHAVGARRLAEAVGAAHRRIETVAPARLRATAVTPADAVPAPAPPPPAAREIAHGPAPAFARRPAMVVRPLAPAPQPAPAEVPGRALPAPRGRASGPPELDIEQLTERVVRQIDHRIVAHRERLGQI